MVLAVGIAAGGTAYGYEKRVPGSVIAAVAVSLVIEAIFYAAIGFASVRERLTKLTPFQLSTILVATAVIPAALYPAALGILEWTDLLVIGLMAAVVVRWYFVLPSTPWCDLAFSAVMIAVVLIKGRFFRELYPDVPPGVHLDVLGHLMWIRTGAAAVLLIRGRAEDIGYGFIPTSAECRIGVRQFMTALPFTLAAGYAVGIMSLGSPAKSLAMVPLLTLGTFVGTYFVVALSEEFLLRGILLRRMIDLTDSIPVACVVTAVVSGAVHLSFRTAWNWKFAIVAGVAHWFYGQAYLEGRGIRAGMVAHSLLVTTWVMAFAKSA